ERELRSETLGVSLRIAGPMIRVRNLDTGKDYLSHEDLNTVAEEATARAEEAEARAEAAEAQLVTLKALLAQSGKQLPMEE
ncbi:MAG: hypothetical protein OXN97_04350, partial [Bryobacterales bacterium]|nr:hypothetical protein [Bryobacterales bacterium]